MLPELAIYTRNELKKIPGIVIYDSGDQQCGIITISAEGFDSTSMRNAIVNMGSTYPTALLQKDLEGV